MRRLTFTTRFKKDLKRQKRRGKKFDFLEHILDEISRSGDAPENCRPHNLSGNWDGHRECHIEPDWLLIYLVQEDEVIFYRTGTHSDLFK